MDKRNPDLHQLIQDIYVTTDDEISCDDAATYMVRAAAFPLSDEETRQQYPQLFQHFHYCPDCATEFNILQELLRAMDQGELTRPTAIPPVPDFQQSTRWSQVQDVIRVIFPVFQPAFVEQVRHGGDTSGFEPVEVTLGEGTLQITFDLAVNEEDPRQRSLFCTILVKDEYLQDRLEGANVWLQMSPDGSALRETTANELGDLAFHQLLPGQYVLRLELAGQVYIVTDINIP